MNNIIIKGRLTEDAALKYTAAGKPVANFSIAYNKSWKDASGEWKEDVYYFSCAWFGKAAENKARLLIKGTPVIVQGELRQERWQAKDGGNREKISLVLDTVDILSSEKSGDPGAKKWENTSQKPQDIPMPDHFDDDGIPF